MEDYTLFNNLGGEQDSQTEEVDVFDFKQDDFVDVETAQKVDESEAKEENKKVEKEESTEDTIDIDEVDDTSGEAAPSEAESGEGDNSKEASPKLQAFAKALVEEGQLSSISEEDLANVKTTADLTGLIKKEIESRELSDLTEKQKELLNGIRNGISSEFLLQSMAQEERLAAISDEDLEKNEDLQANLYMNELISKGFTKEKAIKLVAQMRESEELFDEAKEALTNIKTRETERRQKSIDNASKQKEQFKEFITKQKEILKGIPVSKEMQDRVYNSITKLETDKDGNYIDKVIKTKNEDPVRFVATLHYLHELGVFGKDFNPEVFGKPVKKKAVEDFEKTLNSQDSYSTMGNSKHKDIEQEADGDLLNVIDKLF